MKYKKDDVLVSTETTPGGRQEGDILVMSDKPGKYYYGKNRESNFASYTNPSGVRYATFEEILAYKKGVRNISELPDVPQPLPIFN